MFARLFQRRYGETQTPMLTRTAFNYLNLANTERRVRYGDGCLMSRNPSFTRGISLMDGDDNWPHWEPGLAKHGLV